VTRASTGRQVVPGRSALLPALTVGIGVAGTVDQVVFHQLLRWHTYYVRSGLDVGLISDGIFHAVMTGVLGTGLVWLVRTARVARPGRGLVYGGVLAGAGGFNLFDGVVDHKILRVHPVREGVEDLLPYDVAWIGSAALVLLLGLVLLRRERARHPGV
jgi:uncharacterized membrane protein